MFEKGWRTRRERAQLGAVNRAARRRSTAMRQLDELRQREQRAKHFGDAKTLRDRLVDELQFARSELKRLMAPDYIAANADERRQIFMTKVETLPARIAEANKQLKPVEAEYRAWVKESDIRLAELNQLAEIEQEKKASGESD